jgi:hypothetical protein
MAIPSNIYADSVFSEHPISLYPLDDDVSYLSLISNGQRLFNQGGWTASANNSASVVLNDSPSLPEISSPFSSDIYTSFVGSGISSNNTTVVLQSPTLFDFDQLNQDLKTFSISLYLYQNSTKINWYEVGYVYFDNFLSSDREIVTRVEASEGSQWINFDFTYNPASFDNTNIRLIIKANVNSGGDESDYTFIVNGICVGQWSENNSSQSLGVFSQSASVFVGEEELFGIPAIEYGVQESSGYYLVENNRLLARNVGVPLIYGSENNTRLYPSQSGLPSLILPGNGFLFNSGKFGEYSLEFWMRINPDTIESRRIFGPLDTDNGLHVRDGVISLILGNEIRSHPVSEWYRPMLIHIILKENSAALYINGEQVFSMPFNKDEISFSDNNDWLGFYSYDDIINFEIDCVSLYPYIVPVQVAKKRFVWGQGTDSPQTVADFFDGKNVYVNFSNANYTTNKTYPDTGRWEAGYSDNLVSTRRSISSPSYSLPEIVIENRNLQDLYDDNKIVCESEKETFFTFRPNQGVRTNLAGNPSVETNTTSWSAVGTGTTIARITNDSKFGSACLQVTKGAVNNAAGRLQFATGTRMAVLPSTTYMISAWVKVPAGNENAGLRIRRSPFTAVTGGSAITATVSATTTVTAANGWVRLSSSITTTSTTNALSISVEQAVAGTAGQLFLIDGVLVEQTSQLLPYFDGSYAEPDAKAISTSWEGTQNNSVSRITFRSESGLNWTEKGYLFFNSLTQVDNLSSVYAVVSLENIFNFSPIMLFKNVNNRDQLEIFVEDGFLVYRFNEDVIYSVAIIENEKFCAGTNLRFFVKSFGYRISQFFQSLGDVQLYVGGNDEETFPGKIFSVGFANKKNNEEISSYFLENGIAKISEHENFMNHTATYTLVPLIRYNRFFLDISISSSWEDYFPLASFASFVKNSKGKKYYDLDYLQLNIGYPSVTERVQEVIENTGWTYQELFKFFNNPVQKSYEVLDNEALSGYSSYNDLNNNNIIEYFLDASKSSLRAFFTFQLLSEGANEPIQNFSYSKDLVDCCFVDAELENTNNDPFKAYLTKFEFADNVVVFPPKNIDFKRVAIVIHFDIKQEGILTNPVRVRDFEIASRSLNQYSFNPIGTENAIPMYPYVKTGIYFDNKEKNPVLLSKKRLPYLHLNQTSGIKVMGRQTLTKEYGVAIPINQEKNLNFSVGAIQLWMKHDSPEFSVVPYPIFEIETLNKTIEFVLRSDASGKRGIILARNKKTKILEEGIIFYQNGIRVRSPIVEFNTWESLGLSFTEPLIFDNFIGYFNIFRGSTFNNISFFNLSGLGETSGIFARKWQRVLVAEGDPAPANFDWDYWYDENGTSPIKQWSGVYVLGETKSTVITPQDIYKTFVGTNRIIVDDGEELNFESEEISLYASSVIVQSGSIVNNADISWSRFSDIPA